MTEKTVTKSVRLDKEIAAFYEDKPLRTVLESVYELIKSGILTYQDGIESESMRELKKIADRLGTDVEGMMLDFVLLLEDGSIKRKDGMLYVDGK